MARIPRAGSTSHRLNTRLRGGLAASSVAALVAALAMGLVGPSATASTTSSSAGSSRFLSGSLLLDSVDLDDVVALQGVSAASETGQPSDTVTSPLDLSALSLLEVELPGGVHIPLSQFLSLGAVNQYAQANPDGTARAAAGAVADSGAIDTRPTSDFPSDAEVDLVGILGAPAVGVLSSASLTLGGITAVAAVDAAAGAPATTCADLSNPADCRDYTLVRGGFDFTSPLVGDLVDTVDTTLDTVSANVDATLSSGLVSSLLSSVDTLLGTLGTLLPGVSLISNDLAVTVSSDLRTALHDVLTQTLTDGLVSINLVTGAIHVDLNALTGGLNDLPPNTEILSSAVITDLVNRIGNLLDGFAQDVSDTVTSVLDAEAVTISGGICLAELLGSCTAGLDIGYTGTLADLASGASALTVTGTGLLVLTDPVLATLVSTLQTALSATTQTVLTDGLGDVNGAVGPAITALTSVLDPVIEGIPSVLSLLANVQEPGSTTDSYREVAVRASIGSGTVVTVDLARAEVSAQTVTAPTTSAASTPSGSATARTSAPATTTTSTDGPPTTPAPSQPGNPNIDTGLGANAHPAADTWWWTALGVVVLAFAALVAGSVVRQARRR